MALVEQIKKRMFAAMKAKKTIEKEILRVAIGEIETAASRTESDALDDNEARAILKKLVKSNREALSATEDTATKQVLEEEISVIQSLLPETLTPERIAEELAPVRQQIVEANNQGPAMGIAMKTLKSKGLEVEAKDVAAALARMRS